MEKLRSAFASLFEVNMGTVPGERVVVFSDIVRPDEPSDAADLDRRLRLHATARAAAEFGAMTYGNTTFVDFPATVASGAEPPEILWQEVFGAALVEELKRGGLLERLLTKEATPADLELLRRRAAALVSHLSRP